MAASVFGYHRVMGRDPLPVLEWLALPVATVLGFLAGLGVGGGSLLMLWLTLVVDMPYASARTINLLFFLPSAIIASLFRRNQGILSVQKLRKPILAGIILAVIGSVAGQYFDTLLLKKFFGGLLIFTGLRELFYRPRNAK